MCGINGILSYKNTNELQNTIAQMNQALVHRGPDSEGVEIHNNIAFGHRRLSIIDLSNAGAQPISDSTKRYSLICNGELYNYKSLKKELHSYKFKSTSDNEVILAAYIKWGKSCLNRFEGMYAFAILDKKENSIFIARDRMGIKPLYYFKSDQAFIFSSEIKALLSSNHVPRTINKRAIFDYLRYQTVHAPQTMIKDVKMLMPGHYIKINNNETKIQKYWELPQHFSGTEKSYDEVKKNVKELMYSSIEKRMMSDVPLGAFLSGGIDSSIITGIMSELSHQKINSFSVNFAEPEFSEGKYARIIAKQFNTNHTEILLKPKDFLHNLPQALKYTDHPSGDGPNSYIVSKVTKEAGITVALSGLGGDELFAGYDIFKQTHSLLNNRLLQNTPALFRKTGAKLLSIIKKDIRSQKIAEILGKDKLNFQHIYPVSRLLFTEKQFNSFFVEKEIPANQVQNMLCNFNLGPDNILSNVSRAEINSYMQNILLRDTDQMSMASSLEVRVPFLDHKLVEYVLQLPDKYKYLHTPKKLLTDSINILPDSIINRPKMGFVLPWDLWLKNELFNFSDERIKNTAARSFFNEKAILKLWSDFLQAKVNTSWARLWVFIVLEDYIQKFNLTF